MGARGSVPSGGSRSARSPLPAAVGLLSLGAAAMIATLAAAAPGAAARPVPRRLSDTGLYSNFAAREIDPRNLHFAPQYPLWTDGAHKSRWIRLPKGAAIDARDPEAWRFPVGTKLWKEFGWSRPVETRYLERTKSGWVYAAYLWAEDGSDAVLAPEGGVASTFEVAQGRPHRIPSVADCMNCHRSGRAEILGFSALQLSPDRDPLAPHAEPLLDGDVTLPALVQRGLVRGLPRQLLDRPPRISAGTSRGRAAMGYLHANCGNCHDSVGPMSSLGVGLRHALDARAEGEEPVAAGFGRSTRFRIPGAPPGGTAWISPGSPASSAVLARMASRTPILQMPPLGTQLVDEQAVALVRSWIEQDLPSPTPPSK